MTLLGQHLEFRVERGFRTAVETTITKTLENTILSYLALWFLEVEVNRQETSFYVRIPVQVLMSNILHAFGKHRRSRFPQQFVSPALFPYACHLYLPSKVLPSPWTEWHFSGFSWCKYSKLPSKLSNLKRKNAAENQMRCLESQQLIQHFLFMHTKMTA